MKRHVKLNKNERGMALVLLLIATSIITMMCIGLIDIFTMNSKVRALTSKSNKRDALLLQLRREGRVGLNLYASIEPSQLPVNEMLKRHIIFDLGDQKESCKAINSPGYANVFHPMRLISDSGTKLAGTGGTDFAYYNEDGSICTPGGKPCVMQVSASFGCYCNDGMGWGDGVGTVCNIPKGIDIRFTVEPVKNSGFNISARTVSQYVPVQDWGFGNWSLITFNASEVFKETPSGSTNPSPTPDPSQTPNPQQTGQSGQSGPPQNGGPTPVPATPTPLPPPVPTTASCPPGETPVDGVCTGFSL
jgi:hypothetical protein